jgi:hypothetical protein
MFLRPECESDPNFLSEVGSWYSIKLNWIRQPVLTVTGNWFRYKFALRDSVTRFLASGFFRQSITPRPQMTTLKYFRILFRIPWEIKENVLLPRYAA